MTIIVNGLELAPDRRKLKIEEILNPSLSIPSLQGPAIEVPKDSLSVCVLQSESCTIPWSHGGVVGSQDATTCVIVFVLCGYGVTVLHFDEDTSISEEYLKRSLVGIAPSEDGLQLHLVGGYDDEKETGRQVVENLLSFFHCSAFRFNLGTATVGSVNTRIVDRGTLKHKAPIFHGACIDLGDRQLRPCTFADRSPSHTRAVHGAHRVLRTIVLVGARARRGNDGIPGVGLERGGCSRSRNAPPARGSAAAAAPPSPAPPAGVPCWRCGSAGA
jgi:hypothetical protein